MYGKAGLNLDSKIKKKGQPLTPFFMMKQSSLDTTQENFKSDANIYVNIRIIYDLCLFSKIMQFANKNMSFIKFLLQTNNL